MAKIALLIGVSEYKPELNPLPGAVKDIEALQKVLHHREMGAFDEIKILPNPEPMVMQEAIETLFTSSDKNDLVLLFFSGHGVKDESGRLFFATPATRKQPSGVLIKATAVSASSVQDAMAASRCKRQVLILDCCFSGAFAEGMSAKDDGAVDIKTQLGGEGRVVLTSSSSTQYSFEQQGSDLSVYTRYIVEGIATGAADSDNDGTVSIDELHDYAQKKVQETAPAMKPQIYAAREGYKIRLAAAAVGDPKLRYRREVERFVSRGDISHIGRRVLDDLRIKLNLSPEEAAAIETETLGPSREYRKRLQKYRQALTEATQRENPLSDYTYQDLKRYQDVLGLRNEDVDPIQAEIASRQVVQTTDGEQKQLAEKYAQALNHFQDGQWMAAINLLNQIVSQEADYKDAAAKLEGAKCQQQVLELTAKAEEAYANQAWDEVVQSLREILKIDPKDQKVKARLDDVKRQMRLINLYNEARRWYREQQWQRVIDTFREIQALDRAYSDPDNLQTSARQQLREKERLTQERKLTELYSQGQRCIDAKEWQQAVNLFEEVTYINPSYRETKALLAHAHQELSNKKEILLPTGLIVGGWLIAFLVANLALGHDISSHFVEGVIGGCVSGLAFSWASSNGVLSISSVVKILASVLVGGVVGVLVCSIPLPQDSFTEAMAPIIKAVLGAVISVALLIIKQHLGWKFFDV